MVNNLLFCQLNQSLRSSQQILDLADYINTHSTTKMFSKGSPSKSSFEGKIPQWLEAENIDYFVKYAKANFKAGQDDVMIIRHFGPDWPRFLELCEEMGWRYYKKKQITGSEASIVILYDLLDFDHEAFTRARNELIIVTTKENAAKSRLWKLWKKFDLDITMKKLVLITNF